MWNHKQILRKILLGAVVTVVVAAALYVAVPRPELLEKYTYSTAVYDCNGRLLHLGLSMDDKYRLRVSYRQIPPEAVKALLLYEDRYFFFHFGVNPLRTVKSALLMLAGARKQGASTITMQLARMVYGIDSSTLSGKFEQILRALQIEMFYSKQEILEAYFNLAPYGMNIEGIAAAAQIYFETVPEKLNRDQIMTLTVIPQNPSKRGLGRHDGKSEAVRAYQRLAKIWQKEYGDDGKSAAMPPAVSLHRPFAAPHLVQQLKKQRRGSVFATIDLNYQQMTEDIVSRYVKAKKKYGIDNAAALIVNRRDMSVLAKVGSAGFFNAAINGQVDGTRAFRSPGSVMKPFIYALALEQGLIHPHSRLKDVPRNFANYMPENYDRRFYGMMDATSALVKSRNVPAVELLLKIGIEKYYMLLKKSKIKRLKNADFYGLALALGGYELTMENVAEMYAMLASGGRFRKLRWSREAQTDDGKLLLSPEAAFLTMDMLRHNPPADRDYYAFAAVHDLYKVYWKTGTSFGYRDAWAAGVAGDYVVVVWLGNFDGRPNPALTGQDAAAPLFFKIVRSLAKNLGINGDDISPAGLNLSQTDVCRSTGDIADADCQETIKSYFIPGVTRIKVSNVSRRVPVDRVTGKRACRHRPPRTVMKSFEFWPSDVLAAYRAAGVAVRRPPEFGEDCDLIETAHIGNAPQILNPADGSVLLTGLARGGREKLLLKASADADARRIFWFRDGTLIGDCNVGESLETELGQGEWELKAVDDKGRFTAVRVTVRPVLSE